MEFKQQLAEQRKKIRNRLLTDALLKDGQELIIYGDFDGYGDSGTVHVHYENQHVVDFLMNFVEENVNFDWYNNEGGGGDFEWDLKSDKIIINGYYKEVQHITAMTEEEF